MGHGPAGTDRPPRLSVEADALLTLRRLCREYHALPSAVLAEDGGLLLQLLQVDTIINEAEVEQAQEQQTQEQWEEVSGHGVG